ncbi:hypothetical protein [Streptomyces flavofungini]|uniref:hypothetical protein n=1 Tax=Streptomyces flavofungini TaxID=68200 RepID=UPI0025B248B3|nr:hypothetical protein [Streptomyces flavofungini]WJV48627.1 hypothetical protein QUY26_25805 [Streptomyces flavofungini]
MTSANYSGPLTTTGAARSGDGAARSSHGAARSSHGAAQGGRDDSLARLTLKLDAAVTGPNGLAYLALAQFLDSFLGLDAALLYPVGAFLLLYAAAVQFTATRPRVARPALAAIITANLLWTVLSLTLAATDALSATTAGTVWVVLQGLVVAGFAGVQWVALGRLRHTGSGSAG